MSAACPTPPVWPTTRRLLGSGAGFFALFNRNKQSLAVNVKDPRGLEVVLKLVAGADIFSENFKAGTMDKLGLGTGTLRALNPRLIYVSHKGFLPGPYENRTALDEVVQMMGGLAYMTGPEGQPLRAGSSVNDIMGGLFSAIGALAALQQRDNGRSGTGRGSEISSALFENNVLLVAQHMLKGALTGQPAAPMPSRISAWALYDVFTVARGEQIFLAAVSDTQWALLCTEFGFADLQADPRVASNKSRVRSRPQDLFDDPHLAATGGLAAVTVPADASSAGHAVHTRVPLLPLSIDGQRLPLRAGPPSLGQHSLGVLQRLGYSDEQIQVLQTDGVVAMPATDTGTGTG